jgi:hypothetical protein
MDEVQLSHSFTSPLFPSLYTCLLGVSHTNLGPLSVLVVLCFLLLILMRKCVCSYLPRSVESNVFLHYVACVSLKYAMRTTIGTGICPLLPFCPRVCAFQFTLNR